MSTTKQEIQYSQWGGFGELIFQGRLSPSAVSDRRQWRVTAMQLANGYPRHQSQGENERVMSLEMKFSNKFTDITKTTRALDDMAEAQVPRSLIIGGKVYGQYVIRSRSQTGMKTTPQGSVLSVIYQCEIVRVEQ